MTQVTNEDLQRQLAQHGSDAADIKNQLRELIALSTETKLNGQALAELQRQFTSHVVHYNEHGEKIWIATRGAQTSVDKLESKIIGGGIVLGVFQAFIGLCIWWAVTTISADDKLLAVHDSRIGLLSAAVETIRHLTGN